jgi:hypothetical protein
MMGRTGLTLFGTIWALLILALPLSHAWNEFFLEGYFNELYVDKQVVRPGETVKIGLNLENASSYPFVDGYFIVQLVHVYGDKNGFTYFSENVIKEQKILPPASFSLRPGETRDYEFSFTIPEFAPPGNYRIDVYFKTPRAYIIGIPFIFVRPPRNLNLKIENDGAYRDVRIDREETVLCGPLSELDFNVACYPGPVGVIVDAGETKELKLVVDNAGKQPERNLMLVMSFYEYDDTLEQLFVKKQTVKLPEIGAGASITQDVVFSAPTKPGAYAIKLEIIDDAGTVLSVFRNRINVKGTSGRIIQVSSNKVAYKKGETVVITVRFLAPSDATTRINSGKLEVGIYPIGDESKRIFYDVKDISVGPDSPLNEVVFTFKAEQDLVDFTIKAALLDDASNTVDAFEQEVKYDKFTPGVSSIEVNVSSKKDASTDESTFLVGQKIYVKAVPYDELGRISKAKVELYIRSDSISLGPYAVNNVYELSEALDESVYEFEFVASNFVVSRTVKVVAPSKLVVLLSKNENFSTEDTEFLQGAPIYVKTEVFDEQGNVQEVPVRMFVKGEGVSIGPITVVGKTTFRKLLKPGIYTFHFVVAGLSEHVQVNILTSSAGDVNVVTPTPGTSPHKTSSPLPPKQPAPGFDLSVFILMGVLAGVLLAALYGILRRAKGEKI